MKTASGVLTDRLYVLASFEYSAGAEYFRWSTMCSYGCCGRRWAVSRLELEAAVAGVEQASQAPLELGASDWARPVIVTHYRSSSDSLSSSYSHAASCLMPVSRTFQFV
jgi:hypothetical protein